MIEMIKYTIDDQDNYRIFVEHQKIEMPEGCGFFEEQPERPKKADFPGSDHGDCACIFCLAKCPLCGSLDVVIRYQDKTIYNKIKNHLEVEIGDYFSDDAIVFCKACTYGTISQKLTEFFDKHPDTEHFEALPNGEIKELHFSYSIK